MRKLLTALALSLIFATPASADYTVTSLTGDWSGNHVALTSNGVQFSGTTGGELNYHGYDGYTVSTLSHLSYTFSYHTSDTTGVNAPWLEVYTTDGAIVLYPYSDKVDYAFPTQDQTLTYNMIDGSAELIEPLATHANSTILYIQIGVNDKADTTALITRFQINGLGLVFSNLATPVDIPDPQPDPGDEPADQHDNGHHPPTPDNDNDYDDYDYDDAYADDSPVYIVKYVGRCKRTLHVAKRRGEKFISARATMHGKKLPVKGRTIVVNLSKKPVGKYSVKIVAKYRKHGKIHIVKTTRHLNVMAS